MVVHMRVDEILERFENVKRRGDHWEARCPAHEDRKPSLSITVGSNDRTLLKCHANCAIEDIVAAAGLQIRDLFVDEQPLNGSRRIVETYGYVDENGRLLFEVVRYEPKDFRQRRPDGAGGWIWKLGDTRRVLYRLPEVVAAVNGGKPIDVVEGEKDADAIRAAGGVATCNPMGAGKWRPEHTDQLRGASWVRVVADDDTEGHKHARQVGRDLRAAGIETTLALPAVGKDASDHLAAGKAFPGELRPLADEEPFDLGPAIAASPTTPSSPWSLEQVVETFRRWLHLPDPRPLYAVLAAVVANRREGDAVWLIVVGPSGSGKTELLSSLGDLPDVFPAATITEPALLSGTARKDRDAAAKGGLLREIGDYGILALKDFGSVLSMNRDTRASVLAALREIADGSWTRRLGVDGGRTLDWSGKLGLIAGCVPTLDQHYAVMSALGERFILFRMGVDDAIAQRARQEAVQLDRIADRARKEVAALKRLAREPGPAPPPRPKKPPPQIPGQLSLGAAPEETP